MKLLSFTAVFLTALSGTINASAPETSLRPFLRVETTISSGSVNHVEASVSVSAPSKSLKPLERPLRANRSARQELTKAADLAEKPKFLERLKRLQSSASKTVEKGELCGVKGIEGVKISSIPGRINGCGISEPVRVTAIGGVTLSQTSIMDCTTAKALHSWVNNSVHPVVGRKGGGVQGLKIAAHYACRTRNNRKGARISEHGKGRAIDISAIQLKDGSSLTVLKDWRSQNAKILRKLHQDACGPFGTVLGPNSDRFHQDHFHFDTARYRSGPYCR